MKKRALISVFDKTGVLEFAKFLYEKNIEIISTGGTYKYLKENGLNIIEISEVTNLKEMLDGRLETLHPNIHGGILAIRDNEEHMKNIKEEGIETIDFVVVNLYPFFKDFGYRGICVFGLIYGAFHMLVYKGYKNRNDILIIVFSIICPFLLLQFFSEYILSNFSTILQMLIISLIPYFLKIKK